MNRLWGIPSIPLDNENHTHLKDPRKRSTSSEKTHFPLPKFATMQKLTKSQSINLNSEQ